MVTNASLWNFPIAVKPADANALPHSYLVRLGNVDVILPTARCAATLDDWFLPRFLAQPVLTFGTYLVYPSWKRTYLPKMEGGSYPEM